MTIQNRDCVVIGGGPAGSTFAAITKKYAPTINVTVLEQARFPRYHIGESTIPAVNNVLRDLEIYQDLERSTFVKKMGIVFVWGEDRKPWSADYLRLKEVNTSSGGSDIIDVTGQDFRGVIDRLGYLETPVTAFNVRRAEYDHMLLNQARGFGAEVREGTRAVAVLRGETGRIEGVQWEDDLGRKGTIMTPFVLDASGLLSFLTKGERDYDPDMNNFAVYGYLSNAEWKVTFNGSRERSTVFIAAVDYGWIWYFPIGPDIMSVGVVTHKRHFKDRLGNRDLEEFWWEMLRSCPEVADLVKKATLRTDILPSGKRVAASQDWSSWARKPIGSGWAAAGDAAIFVDPILSSGVTLAIQSGHRAAYTFNTERARPDVSALSLWKAYATYIRGEYGSFLKMARYFYGNNRAAKSWWWEAQQIVNRTGRLELDDHQSFTMATAGFFPAPRTNTSEVVGSLIEHLTGTKADILNVLRETGLPEDDEMARSSFEVRAPFRLDVRTEPPSPNGLASAPSAPAGQLDVFYDLVTDDKEFAHRLAAVPTRIAAALAPIVERMNAGGSVAALLAEAPRLLPLGIAPEADIRRSTLEVMRVAAMKGFIHLCHAERVDHARPINFSEDGSAPTGEINP
ncbi:MAG TPA: NAD(P)/FAD-dependent oxidoreductase [Pyrinomonadaceae bacterium]|jgi:clorobiocin biosynthesis protein Clo-hal